MNEIFEEMKNLADGFIAEAGEFIKNQHNMNKKEMLASVVERIDTDELYERGRTSIKYDFETYDDFEIAMYGDRSDAIAKMVVQSNGMDCSEQVRFAWTGFPDEDMRHAAEQCLMTCDAELIKKITE